VLPLGKELALEDKELSDLMHFSRSQ